VGILADSTVIIAVERAGSTPRQVIAGLIARYGDAEAALSVITVVARRAARERFLDEFLSEMTLNL